MIIINCAMNFGEVRASLLKIKMEGSFSLNFNLSDDNTPEFFGNGAFHLFQHYLLGKKIH